MPRTKVALFREEDGTIPSKEWFDDLIPKALVKCRVRLGRLAECGHELRRPEADFLRDGIYELRVGLQGMNYRMLYFFHGKNAVVVSHGLTKEEKVPEKEIELALRRNKAFEVFPKKHTATE